MTGLQLLAICGAAVAGGVFLAVRGLRPAPPQLDAALEQLSPEAIDAGRPTGAAAPDRRTWLPAPVAGFVDAHLGVSDADLLLLGLTRSQLAAKKITWALAAFLTPAVIGALCAVLGIQLPFVIPVGLSVGLAVWAWWLPSAETREAAVAARREFRSALESFLMLVAGERRARGSVEQALEEAVEISGSPAFGHLRRALRRAALAGHKPWSDLKQLGEQLQLPELRNLADIASTGADGAAIYKTLMASARTLRHAELADLRTAANEASERMSRPLALQVFALALFIFVPYMLRMFGIAT